MPTATLERVVEDVKTLTAQEQRQLREMLDDWLPKSPTESEIAGMTEKEKEQLLLQRLLEKGIISKIPSGERSQQQFKPVKVLGRPVSETLLEDRR